MFYNKQYMFPSCQAYPDLLEDLGDRQSMVMSQSENNRLFQKNNGVLDECYKHIITGNVRLQGFY